jgi:hypothetical protein
MNRMRSAMCMTAAMMFAAVTMAAQDATDKAADKMGKMDKKSQSLTGCVQAGSAPGTYMLTNAMPAMGDKMAADTMKSEMGSITLSATDVDLAPHVGHKVTVSGTMMGKKHGDMSKDDKASADKAAPAMDSGAGPTLKVKSLTMVATACS